MFSVEFGDFCKMCCNSVAEYFETMILRFNIEQRYSVEFETWDKLPY